MIGFLEGKIQYYTDSIVLINVNGVGYRVFVPIQISSTISKIGQEMILHTHTHVREDILELYGFKEVLDLNLFEMLLSVSGIGPKTALGIFAKGERNQIIEAIANADVSFFAGIPRLGKKNAQKIIIELKNKIGSAKELDLLGVGDKETKDLVEALKSFGFSTKESMEAIKSIQEKDAPVDRKIRFALKYLGK